MFNVWLGAKPLLNRKGQPARFSFDMAMHLKSLYRFAKVRPCNVKGKWGDRIVQHTWEKKHGHYVQG
jgi:hypothetical protein